MKGRITQAQENSLRKLFSSNQADREQIIALLDPKIQQSVRELVRVRRDFNLLCQILMADLGHASGEMKKSPEDQFWRRMAIRALAVTLDGIIFGLKQLALASGKLIEFRFNADELFLLSEEKINQKGRLPSFRENIKQTFKLFAKVHRVSCPTDFGGGGFGALCETYDLRHRLVHPKSFKTFCVSDEERNQAGKAIAWLSEELQKLLEASSRGLDNFNRGE